MPTNTPTVEQARERIVRALFDSGFDGMPARAVSELIEAVRASERAEPQVPPLQAICGNCGHIWTPDGNYIIASKGRRLCAHRLSCAPSQPNQCA